MPDFQIFRPLRSMSEKAEPIKPNSKVIISGVELPLVFRRDSEWEPTKDFEKRPTVIESYNGTIRSSPGLEEPLYTPPRNGKKTWV